MKTPSRIGLVVAPVAAALLVGFTAFIAPAIGAPGDAEPEDDWQWPVVEVSAKDVCPKGAAGCADLIEVEVKDVVPLEEAGAHAVVLVAKQGGTVLPIFVDEGSAVAIAFRLANKDSPHPLAQDLIEQLVDTLGGKVTEVRIDSLKDDVFEGRILMNQGQKKFSVDARPSDSIALALGRNARIYVARTVMAQAGISQKEIDELRGGMSPHPELPGDDEGQGVGGSGEEGIEGAPELPPGHPALPPGQPGLSPGDVIPMPEPKNEIRM